MRWAVSGEDFSDCLHSGNEQVPETVQWEHLSGGPDRAAFKVERRFSQVELSFLEELQVARPLDSLQHSSFTGRMLLCNRSWWNGWMASPTQCTWIWANSRRWWRTGKLGMLQFMGLQSWTRLSDWTTTTTILVVLQVSRNLSFLYSLSTLLEYNYSHYFLWCFSFLLRLIVMSLLSFLILVIWVLSSFFFISLANDL